MSRSGYSDDIDGWDLIRWRGAVASAMRGKRGQAFLREVLAALDALPEKKLIPNEFEADGAYCTLGAVGKARGLDMSALDPYDDTTGDMFGIANAMAKEIMWFNDEASLWKETPEARWQRVRNWVASKIWDWQEVAE